MADAERIGGKVIVAGVGSSQIGRATGRGEGSLALEACQRAIADSGLPRDAIDGIVAYPDRVSSPYQGPSIAYVHRALGLRNTRYYQAFGTGPGPLCSLVNAVYALVSGAASAIICYRAHALPAAPPPDHDPKPYPVSGEAAFTAPYGLDASTPRYALWAQRHAHELGTTDRHRGAVVLTCRENAQRNPDAIWYGSPLSMSEYLASDVVASPLRLLDCDMPVDGAVAVVLTRADRAPDIRKRPVVLESIGHAAGPTIDPDIWPDFTYMAARFVGDQLWAGTDLEPGDVDVAEVYDGFSTLALCWLEDLGFVGKGEAGQFLLDGHGRLGGQLPICTDGGQLGAGRIHGMRQVATAVRQLRGECGEHQVAGAEVAVASVGGGPAGTALLLTG